MAKGSGPQTAIKVVPSLFQLYNEPRRTWLDRGAIVLASCSAFFPARQGSPRCSCGGDLRVLTCELNLATPSTVLTWIPETFPAGHHQAECYSIFPQF